MTLTPVDAHGRHSAADMRAAIRSRANADIATHSTRFFKSGKGEYGEGDRFHGVRVPVVRSLVKNFRDAPLRSVVALLKSPWHEERLFAVLLLAEQYKRGDAVRKQAVFDTYIEYRRFVNNWDIVDSSAHKIMGPHLEHGPRDLLYELAVAESLWDRRIAMMATYHYIRQDDFVDTLKLARILRDDEHDLIHKIVGW
ncbi:MAG: DNA alkylation repair protein, partial [Pseudomonadota bacterium]